MYKSSIQRTNAVCLAWILGAQVFSNPVFANDQVNTQEYTLDQALEEVKMSESVQTVSLEKAIEQAVLFSKQTVAEQANQFAESELSQAELTLPDPVLSFQLNNLPVTGATGFNSSAEPITRKTIGISQKWTREDRRERSSEVALSRAGQSKYREQEVITQIKQETAKAWLDAFYGQKMVELLEARVEELNVRSQAATALYNAGTGSQANVFAARTDKGLANLQLSRARTQQANFIAQLKRWLGSEVKPADQESRHWETLLHPVEHLLDVKFYPAIQVVAQQAETAKSSLALQKESLEPDWTLSVQYSQRGNNFSDTLSLAASRPLLFNSDEKQAREIAAAQARYETVVAQQTEMERAMLTQVQQLFSNWKDGVVRVRELEGELLPLARQRTQATMDEYKGNTGNLEQVLLARRMEIDLDIELLKIKMETARWWAQLQYLLPEGEVL